MVKEWVWYAGGWWWCKDWGAAWAQQAPRRRVWVDGPFGGGWDECAPQYWYWTRRDGWTLVDELD
jgi:hypothetical protein